MRRVVADHDGCMIAEFPLTSCGTRRFKSNFGLPLHANSLASSICFDDCSTWCQTGAPLRAMMGPEAREVLESTPGPAVNVAERNAGGGLTGGKAG